MRINDSTHFTLCFVLIKYRVHAYPWKVTNWMCTQEKTDSTQKMFNRQSDIPSSNFERWWVHNIFKNNFSRFSKFLQFCIENWITNIYLNGNFVKLIFRLPKFFNNIWNRKFAKIKPGHLTRSTNSGRIEHRIRVRHFQKVEIYEYLWDCVCWEWTQATQDDEKRWSTFNFNVRWRLGKFFFNSCVYF